MCPFSAWPHKFDGCERFVSASVSVSKRENEKKKKREPQEREQQERRQRGYMGGQQSLSRRPYYRDDGENDETADKSMFPSQCTLVDVKEMESKWRARCRMEFGLKRTGLAHLFPKDVSDRFLDDIWECFRRGSRLNENTRVDALSLLAVFYSLCDASSTEEKARCLFALFDFNGNQSMSKDELTILFISAWYGFVGFWGDNDSDVNAATTDAIEVKCERVAEDAFVFKQMDDPTSRRESIDVSEFLLFLNEKFDTKNNNITINDVLRVFKCATTFDNDVIGFEYGDYVDSTDSDDDDVECVDGEAEFGDALTSIKPWLGAIKRPTNPPKSVNASPNAQLELKWTYGAGYVRPRNTLISIVLYVTSSFPLSRACADKPYATYKVVRLCSTPQPSLLSLIRQHMRNDIYSGTKVRSLVSQCVQTVFALRQERSDDIHPS